MTNREYTTNTKIAAFLNKTITDNLSDYILAAQKYIEDYTGRVFKADTTATSRVFDGTDRDYLLIDDCIQITKVEVGADSYGEVFSEVPATGADKYILRPDNYDKLDPKLPVTRIVLTARNFSKGLQNQRITAKWGSYATAPADISFAATVIASGMYNAKRGGEGKKSESIGHYSVTFSDESWSDFARAKEILSSYTKLYI